jgi:hypothetical protein
MRPAAVAVVATDLVMAFGFVVGFNQLGTQSPVDAILPVAAFSVGVAGILGLVAALLGHLSSDASDPDGDGDGDGVPRPRALTPPTLDQGFAAFGIGLLALASVGWRWGVTVQAALVAAQGIALLLAAERAVVLTLRDDPRRPDIYRLCLLVPEAVLLIGFAWAALADAGIRPFT